jgi:serine/threonine protein kinase
MNYTHLGKSGCRLEIKNDLIIRKSSTQLTYSDRLLKQAHKQANFPQSKYDNLFTPKVYQLENSPLSWFEMEYLTGSAFIDFFETSSFQSIESATNIIINFLKVNLKEANSQSINQLLLDKLEFLSKKSQFSKTISRLETHIINHDLIIPNSYCHGDMTLSNMLFINPDIYLIDFLDSFVNSVLIDLVKLKQDLYYYWSLEMVNVRKTRFISIFSYIWSRIETEFNLQVNSNVFKVLEVINFLRIEPYISTSREFDLLSDIISRLGEYD